MAVPIILFIAIIFFILYKFSYNLHRENEFDNIKARKASLEPQYAQEYERLVEEYHAEQTNRLGSPVKDKIKLEEHISYSISAYNLMNNHLLVVKDIPPYKYYISESEYSISPSKPGHVEVLADLYIPDIVFWTEKGNVQYTTTVSGGGSNLDGAIAGAIIGGAAGAIIGSREQITSKVNTIDSRVISVRMNSGKEEELPFSYEKVLKAFIPEKEYSFMQIKSSLGAN